MNIRALQRGLQYCGRVDAIRQTYHVFDGKGLYLELSFARGRTRRGSGNYNLVGKEAVDNVHGRFGGKRGVTANAVVAAARRTRHIPTRLLALNVLYVLVALKVAAIDRTGEHRQLFFSVRKRRNAGVT
jgi:hypothetical protein